ncbi:DEAD/DEAH box helicase [Cryomorpha ignava]|uniref:DEAD/DEAH box helicase n=1 Tax=Cryomorpha ignava TaxID=101383 RepID=A0A7K3WRK1_9FLAO|nr:DEAD/DEAH box helicase [Cryomorpha ignava]NEN23671.1 DEAD/DEAH box helicase [Cryomorpha ignava]
MISISDRVDGFFNRNVIPEVLQRGRAYYLSGHVESVSIKPLQKNIFFGVKGTMSYQVFLNVDIHSVKLIYEMGCNCPYSGKGACKHIAAAGLWIKANWKTLSLSFDKNQEFTWPEVSKIDQASLEITENGWLLKNFKSFNREVLYRSLYKRHIPELRDFTIRQADKGHYEITLAIRKTYFYSQAEIFTLNAVSDNIDLKLSCSCGDERKRVCDHIAVFLKEVSGKQLTALFTDLDEDFVEKKGAEMLNNYGFDKEANWMDYFEIGFSDNVKTIVPKPSLSNLISPELWSLENPGSAFSTNPNHELPTISDTDQPDFEMGFSLEFDPYDGDFDLIPIVARANKKGVPMSIGFKEYDKIGFSDHVVKQNRDISLLALCNALSVSFGSESMDEKIKYLLEYKTALEEHPNIYLNTAPSHRNFRKGDLLDVKFQSTAPRLKYILTEKDGFVEIQVAFNQGGAEVFLNAENIEDLHRNFLKSGEHIYLLISDSDINHVRSARKLDGKMVALSKLPALFEKYLGYALKSSDVEFINFKKYAVSTQTVTAVAKEIYLSEVGNFVLFRPFIRYENDYLMDALSQESQWEVGEEGIVKTEQDMQKADEFRNELCEIYPMFKDQFSRTDYLHISYRDLMKDNTFIKIFGKFEELEIKVFGLRDLKGLKVNPYPGKVIYSVKSGVDWFEVEAKIAFGDIEIGIDQLKKRFIPGSDYIELSDGSKGIIPAEWLKKLERLFESGEVKGDKLLVSSKKFTLVEELFDALDDEVTLQINDKKSKLLNFDKIQTHPLPKGIKGTLRHYQEDGFQWLCFLDEFKWGGILADDMGLGKTLQIITFLKHVILKTKQANLIVVPTSLLFNWENEIKKFAPSLKVHFYYGSQRIKSTDNFKKYDIVFTSYGHALSDIEVFKDYNFNYVILDESQAIKNPASKRYKAVRLLKANNRIAMTGTPIENNTFDLFAQMSFLNPGFLGAAKNFKNDFAKAIDTDRDENRAAELQRLIKPFVLRRTKKQVATELPDKTEEVLYCEMDKSQQKVYDAFRNEYRNRLIEKIDEEGVNKARFAVLEGLTKLRQICDTPEILPGDEKYTGKSVKIDLLVRHIKEKTANHKILIFSQFVKMLRVIEGRIKEEGISYEYLDGQSNTTQRQASVEHFQEDETCRVFLISLKAGGTGLNLMAADYVYIVDPWWNPAVENQAIDRCYRIGQDKKVIAYRMICKNTVEEKIMELQKKKKAIAGDIVTTDEGILKKLNKDDLMDLFG